MSDFHAFEVRSCKIHFIMQFSFNRLLIGFIHVKQQPKSTKHTGFVSSLWNTFRPFHSLVKDATEKTFTQHIIMLYIGIEKFEI